jgi:hypothetical protein
MGRDRQGEIALPRSPSLKHGQKPLSLTPPQTGLPKTLESGLIEIPMGHTSYRRIVFPKVSYIYLGKSEVAALKFFSAPPVAGSNRDTAPGDPSVIIGNPILAIGVVFPGKTQSGLAMDQVVDILRTAPSKLVIGI